MSNSYALFILAGGLAEDYTISRVNQDIKKTTLYAYYFVPFIEKIVVFVPQKLIVHNFFNSYDLQKVPRENQGASVKKTSF